MLLRLIQIGIVGFWLVTTGWLVRSVWFPGGMESGDMEPAKVLDLFFNWNESNNLVVLENGRRIGLVTVSGFAGIDSETGLFTRGFSTTGSLESMRTAKESEIKAANWRVTVEFDKEFELIRGQVSFRLPGEDLRVALEVEGEPAVLTARVERGPAILVEIERPLDEISGATGQETGNPNIPPGALPFGFSEADLELWKPEISARRATLKIDDGPDLDVYLLRLMIPSDGHEIRAYVSQQGEPLRIETSWGHEAVAEALLPLEISL